MHKSAFRANYKCKIGINNINRDASEVQTVKSSTKNTMTTGKPFTLYYCKTSSPMVKVTKYIYSTCEMGDSICTFYLWYCKTF